MDLFNLESRFFTRSVEFFSNFRLSFFLLMCFILGGTSQDIVAPKLVLYLISTFIIGICLSIMNRESRFWRLKTMNIMLGWLAGTILYCKRVSYYWFRFTLVAIKRYTRTILLFLIRFFTAHRSDFNDGHFCKTSRGQTGSRND